VRGEWAPGTVLQEQTLASAFHTSKTPVRESLIALTLSGLVTPVPRVGYVVAGVDLEGVAEVFRLRVVLESELAAAAAVAGTYPAAGPTPDEEHRFHQALAQVSAGPRMERILEDLLDDTDRALHHVHLAPDMARVLAADHAAMGDAVRAHDQRLAQALMTIHLTRMRESIMSSLRQQLRERNILA
jgi:DNA-binding GntR family transcriptional regulator